MPRTMYEDMYAEEQYNKNDVSKRISDATTDIGDYQSNMNADRTIKMVKGLLKEGDRRINAKD